MNKEERTTLSQLFLTSLIYVPASTHQTRIGVIQSVIQGLSLKQSKEGSMVKFAGISRNKLIHAMLLATVCICYTKEKCAEQYMWVCVQTYKHQYTHGIRVSISKFSWKYLEEINHIERDACRWIIIESWYFNLKILLLNYFSIIPIYRV